MSTTSQTPPPESSQLPDPEEPSRPDPIRWYNYWPKWRRVMMSGALVLLIGALIPALQGNGTDRTGWLPNASLIAGYGFLAYGFFLAMRARKDARSDGVRWTGENKNGWTEPEVADDTQKDA